MGMDKDKDQIVSVKSYISDKNSSEVSIDNGANFTGEWEETGNASSIKVAVKTDQNGYYEIQWSTNKTDVDSTLTRYYRTNQIAMLQLRV